MENKPTIITISHDNRKLSAELSWDANIYDIMEALDGLIIGSGYHKDCLIDWAKDKAEEQQ